MKEFDQFINGKFVKSTSTEVFEVLNPCTEEVLSTVPKGSVADAEAAVEAAELSASSSETQALSKRQAVANSKARINRAKTSLKRTIINLNESQRKLKDLAVKAGFDGVLANVTGAVFVVQT